MDLSPVTPTKDTKHSDIIPGQEINNICYTETPSGYVVTVDNTSYVTVEGARYAGEFSDYLRADREKPQLDQHFSQQRYNSVCDAQRKDSDGSGGDKSQDFYDDQDSYDTKSYHPLQMCVYLMSKVIIHMDLEDGVNSKVQDLVQAIIQIEELGLPRMSANIFTLWMSSGLVELQLKPELKPFEIRQHWTELVKKFSTAAEDKRLRDEPVVTLRRNVFFHKKDEEKIKDQKLLDLLYEEAKYNILSGRYPCDVCHYISLGGIQARIELGPYNSLIHTVAFFRENQTRFLPSHIRTTWSWLKISGKNSPEVRLLEQFKRIPTSTPNRKLIRKYLEFCWSLPYYGSAFFLGQTEQPVRGPISLITQQDIPVLVAINSQGVYVIDQSQCILLLGLKYEDMSWDYARPSHEFNNDCLPCLFLQFMVLENGTRVSKILQVFSKQAVMMDVLITSFVEELKRKVASEETTSSSGAGGTGESRDRVTPDNTTENEDNQINNRRDFPLSCLSNKLSKLTLATFDDNGHCIGNMGSWSFSY